MSTNTEGFSDPQPERDLTSIGRQDFADVRTVMDKVFGGFPIYAVRIGFRTDSTPAERRLGEWMFDVSRQWEEVRREVYGEEDAR